MVMALDNTHIFFWLKIEEEEGCFCKKCRAGKFFPKEPMTEIGVACVLNFVCPINFSISYQKKLSYVLPRIWFQVFPNSLPLK